MIFMPKFDIVTMGAATRDMFLTSDRFETKRDARAPDGLDACLPLGSKIELNNIFFATGGGATNAAVTFARFGLKTACITRLGDDPGGREVLDQLKRQDISVRGVQLDKKNYTAYSIILLAGAGSRAILVARGASQQLDGKSIAWDKLKSGWLYVTSLAGNAQLLGAVFKQAKRQHTRVAWNPGNGEIEQGFDKLLPWLMQSDVLIMNREEAAGLADKSPRDLTGICKTLGSLPRLCLIVTDGAHGAYAHARGLTWFAPPLKGKVVNTTGAGDAFGSGFLAALLKDGDIQTGLQAGTLNAFGVVSHMGAKAGILKAYPHKQDLARVKVRQLD